MNFKNFHPRQDKTKSNIFINRNNDNIGRKINSTFGSKQNFHFNSSNDEEEVLPVNIFRKTVKPVRIFNKLAPSDLYLDNRVKNKTKNQTDVIEIVNKLVKNSSQNDFHVPNSNNSKTTYNTIEEKFKLLEDLDINNVAQKNNLRLDRPIVAGTCKDMCPEKERYMREFQDNFSIFERDENSLFDHRRAVKEYERCSIDQKESQAHDLRPTDVLDNTMNYLLTQIVDIADEKVSWQQWYSFLWNRTRSIRKDITQQNLCNETVVKIIESITRFHIFCAAWLCEETSDNFDPRMNDEHLKNCLQTLKNMYADMPTDSCVNEPEFRSYMIVLNLDKGEMLDEAQKLTSRVFHSPKLTFAISVYQAVSTNNYVRFFRLLEQADLMLSCLLHRFIVPMRLRAMEVINKAYVTNKSTEYRANQIPLNTISRQLKFESMEEVLEFCKSINQEYVNQSDNVMIVLNSANLIIPRNQELIKKAIMLVETKQGHNKLSMIFNGGHPVPDNNNIACCRMVSFNELGQYIGVRRVPPPSTVGNNKPSVTIPDEIVEDQLQQEEHDDDDDEEEEEVICLDTSEDDIRSRVSVSDGEVLEQEQLNDRSNKQSSITTGQQRVILKRDDMTTSKINLFTGAKTNANGNSLFTNVSASNVHSRISSSPIFSSNKTENVRSSSMLVTNNVSQPTPSLLSNNDKNTSLFSTITTTSSSLFSTNANNNNVTTPLSSSLFSTNNNNVTTQSSSSLFSTNNNNVTTQSSLSLFSTNNNNVTSSSLFSTNNNNVTSSSSSLFSTNNNNVTTSSLFDNQNNKAMPSLFHTKTIDNNIATPLSTSSPTNLTTNTAQLSTSSLFSNKVVNNDSVSSLFPINNQKTSSIFSPSPQDTNDIINKKTNTIFTPSLQHNDNQLSTNQITPSIQLNNQLSANQISPLLSLPQPISTAKLITVPPPTINIPPPPLPAIVNKPTISKEDINNIANSTVNQMLSEFIANAINKEADVVLRNEILKSDESIKIEEGLTSYLTREVVNEVVRVQNCHKQLISQDIASDLLLEIINEQMTELASQIVEHKKHKVNMIIFYKKKLYFKSWQRYVKASINSRRSLVKLSAAPRMVDDFSICEQFRGKVRKISTDWFESRDVHWCKHPIISRMDQMIGASNKKIVRPHKEISGSQTTLSFYNKSYVPVKKYINDFMQTRFVNVLNMQLNALHTASRVDPLPEIIISDYNQLVNELVFIINSKMESPINLSQLKLVDIKISKDITKNWKNFLSNILTNLEIPNYKKEQYLQNGHDIFLQLNHDPNTDISYFHILLFPWISIIKSAVLNKLEKVVNTMSNAIIEVQTDRFSIIPSLQLENMCGQMSVKQCVDECRVFQQQLLKQPIPVPLVKVNPRSQLFNDIWNKVCQLQMKISECKETL